MCPDCLQPLVAFELQGIEIDRCLRCRGTWLDAGELEEILARSGGEVMERSELLEASRRGDRTRRRCPRCRARLRHLAVDATDLDRCPRGHGLWFDRGELETVVASRTGGETGAVASFFGELYRSELSPHS